VILATNIAETSLTIEGIRTVIDSGLARVLRHDWGRGLDRLELTRISRASAAQRAGRAGRQGPGRCLRLWAERETRGLAEFETPEVQRVDLASTALAIRSWGSTPADFDWFDPPSRESLEGADRLLGDLGALDQETRRVTDLGRQLLRLPVHPRIGRMLVEGGRLGLANEAAGLAALLSEKDIVLLSDPVERPGRAKTHGPSDLLWRLDLLDEAERLGFPAQVGGQRLDPRAVRQVGRVRGELARLAQRIPIEQPATDRDESLLWIALTGYPDRVARRREAGSRLGVMVGGRGVRLDAESVVRDSEFFLALDARDERRGGVRGSEVRVRIASALRPEWLVDGFPEVVQYLKEVLYDRTSKRVVSIGRLTYRDLVLKEDGHLPVDPGESGEALARAFRDEARGIVSQDEDTAQLVARIECLHDWMPEQDWPELGDEEFGELLRRGAEGLRTEEELRGVAFGPLVKGLLTGDQRRRLEELAPGWLVVPSGSRVRLDYARGSAPVLAVRLQELFGWSDTPRVAGGRVAVVVHLLGPNFRPVQVTSDLRSFWTSTYFQVRKDLRARYPRHAWPEDPLTARAEAKGGRRREG
jgi:ATP-dependent helicase HrpB